MSLANLLPAGLAGVALAGPVADATLAGLLLLEGRAVAVAAVEEAEEGRALDRAAEVEADPRRHLLLVLHVDDVGVARDAHVRELRVVRVAELVLPHGVRDVLHLVLHAADVLEAVLEDRSAVALGHLQRLEAVRLAQVDPALPGARLLLAVDVEAAPTVVPGVEAPDAREAVRAAGTAGDELAGVREAPGAVVPREGRGLTPMPAAPPAVRDALVLAAPEDVAAQLELRVVGLGLPVHVHDEAH